MTKHHRTAGVDYRDIEIGDATYRLRPITIGDYARMEAYIVSLRPDPLLLAGQAIASLPASQHDAVWKAAMAQAVKARTVTSEEAAEFENSVDGLAWKLWQSLKQDHPEIDGIEAAKDLMIQAGESQFEKLARSVEIASGEADMGKSSGRAAEKESEAAPVGLSSTDNSASLTDGRLTKSMA